VVKVVGIGGDGLEGGGELGLLEEFSGFVEIAVALEDALRR